MKYLGTSFDKINNNFINSDLGDGGLVSDARCLTFSNDITQCGIFCGLQVEQLCLFQLRKKFTNCSSGQKS
jgi:hypothetical protein